MFRIFFAVLYVCSLHLQANELISLEKLYSKPNIRHLELNPNGELLYTAGYPDGRTLTLNVINVKNRTFVKVYKARNGEKNYLNKLLWIDDTTFVFSTYRHGTVQVQAIINWLVELTDDGDKFKIREIHAEGEIIDALPDQEKTVWFAKKRTLSSQNSESLVEVYKANVNALVRNNFSREHQFDETIDGNYQYLTDPMHEIRFAKTYMQSTGNVRYLYLDEYNDWQELAEYDEQVYDFRPIGFLPNGKLAVLTNLESDLKGLFEFDVESKSLDKLIFQHERFDIDDAWFNHSGTALEKVAYYAEGLLTEEYINKEDKLLNTKLLNTFKGKQIQVSSTNNDNNKAILSVFASDHSGEYYYWDKENNKAYFIGKRYEEHQDYKFSKTELVNVKAEEGHVIESYYTPAAQGTDNGVLLVMPHGGPIGPRDYRMFSPLVQYFSTRGYAVLQVNYRGSEGFGKSYKDQGRAQWGRKIEEDITLVVDHIHKLYHFKQTCAIGASYGGYSSMMLAALHPQRYDCVIARFGVFDIPLIFNDRNTKQDEALQKGWSQVIGNDDAKLYDYSPVYFSEKIKVPVLITAGYLDTQASFEHSNRMKYVLEQRGADVEHVYYRFSGHGHQYIGSITHELAYIDDFLRRKLALPLAQGSNSALLKVNELLRISAGFASSDIAGPDVVKSKSYERRANDLW